MTPRRVFKRGRVYDADAGRTATTVACSLLTSPPSLATSRAERIFPPHAGFFLLRTLPQNGGWARIRLGLSICASFPPRMATSRDTTTRALDGVTISECDGRSSALGNEQGARRDVPQWSTEEPRRDPLCTGG